MPSPAAEYAVPKAAGSTALFAWDGATMTAAEHETYRECPTQACAAASADVAR